MVAELLAHTTDLVATFSPAGVLSWISPRSLEVLGYPPEGLVGRELAEVLTALPGEEAALATSFAAGDGKRAMVCRALRADGYEVRLETRFWARPAWARPAEERPAEERPAWARPPGDGQVLAVARDVTDEQVARLERQELERRNRRAAEEWQRTCDAIASPIMLVTAEGYLRRMNRAARELLDRPWADCIGQRLSSLGEQAPLPALDELRTRLAASARALTVTVRDPQSDRTWELEGAFLDSAQVDRGFVLQVRDRTATARLEEALRRAETTAALAAVVDGVAHEVRNPLFGMSAVLDAFDSRYPEIEAGQRRYLGLLRGELERMVELMRALQDYGRPGPFDFGRHDLHGLLARAVDQSRPLAEREAIRLVLSPPPERPVYVSADPDRLPRAIVYLIENAIQFSPPGGPVEIVLGVDDGEPTLALVGIRDHGPGFVEADLGRLGEPFYSLRPGGIGLGLAIVSRIMLEHGGRLTGAEAAGGGARVELRLPRLAE
jgi:signal transduction histidine kinase